MNRGGRRRCSERSRGCRVAASTLGCMCACRLPTCRRHATISLVTCFLIRPPFNCLPLLPQATNFAIQQEKETCDQEPFDCASGPDKPMVELVAGGNRYYQVHMHASTGTACCGVLWFNRRLLVRCKRNPVLSRRHGAARSAARWPALHQHPRLCLSPLALHSGLHCPREQDRGPPALPRCAASRGGIAVLFSSCCASRQRRGAVRDSCCSSCW